jgi:hypothetical protein
MSATELKSTKRRFSSLNDQNFEFFRLVPRSPTHTGLICGKTLEPNISSLGPFNGVKIACFKNFQNNVFNETLVLQQILCFCGGYYKV